MRELRQTKIDGRIYLFPVPVIKERKYLVSCSTEEEAKKIISAVHEKKIPHPDLISEHFVFLTFHSDQQTKIFVVHPKSLT